MSSLMTSPVKKTDERPEMFSVVVLPSAPMNVRAANLVKPPVILMVFVPPQTTSLSSELELMLQYGVSSYPPPIMV